MGKITEAITEIQRKENLTLPELFEKYPHLVKLQYEEQLEEQNICKNKKYNKKLLCD